MLGQIAFSRRARLTAVPAALLIINSFAVFPARASSQPPALKILSLLESKQYAAAVRMLEKEIRRSRSQSQKGHYALLLSQIPLSVRTKKPRHEYSFMAARHAENIPRKKRMQLWIEAADGFFKNGNLNKAEGAYKKASSLAREEKARSETVYILYKRAWTWVNQKDHIKAFYFLIEAEKEKKSRLRENILFDIGRVWAESQYLKSKAPIAALAAVFQSVGSKEKKSILDGIIRGMRRKKKNINKVFSALLKNQTVFSQTVNHILTGKIALIPGSCGLIPYMEKAAPAELSRDESLSVLNVCSRALISKKRKTRSRKSYLKKIINLYLAFERRGIERWPLTLIYEYLGRKDRACEESLRQLTEIAADLGLKAGLESKSASNQKTKGKKILESFGESFRLCGEAKKPDMQLIAETANSLLMSDELMKRYTTAEGAWENIFFQFLDSERFFPAIKNLLLKLPAWKGKKDLPPMLFLSHIKEYQPEEIKAFLSRFSPKPAKSYYIDILIEADFLAPEEMEAYLPLSRADSYRKIAPWFQMALSEKLSAKQKDIIISKLLDHFPSKKEDQKTAALFLALHYLKTGPIADVFRYWGRVSAAFEKKALAMELFEKGLGEAAPACRAFSSSFLASADSEKKSFQRGGSSPKNAAVKGTGGGALMMAAVKNSSLLQFMRQCCLLMESKGDAPKHEESRRRLKPPAVLKGSPLAGDFVFLADIQNRTVYLEKDISRLESRTSEMIMKLKSSILRHQKRKWSSKALVERAAALLQKQIEIFERELGRLAASSPHGAKYEELKKIVAQWR